MAFWTFTLFGVMLAIQACSGRLPFPPVEGLGLRQITYDLTEEFYADWSPDGQRLSIISDRTGAWNVWVIHADGSSPQVLASDHQVTSPAWSPDGRVIAYATDRATGMRFWTDLWIMRSDGRLPEPLIQTPTMKEMVPAWSPDGQQIAFLMLDMNTPPAWRMMLMEVESRQPHEISRDKVLFSRLVWSPDGKEIAFISDRSGKPELWIMDRDGKQARPVTHDGAEKEHPDWSPDGKWIAFASRLSGNWDLWVVHPDGTGLKRLTTSPAMDTLPDWSPDSQKIAFTSDRSGNQDIWVMNVTSKLF